MIVREVLPEEKDQFDQAVDHPLQSWEWGEFRQKTGKKVIRLGVFGHPVDSKKAKLRIGYQLTVHPIPQTSYTILYFPRGPMPDKIMINALNKIGQQEKAILVKMAPNIFLPVGKNIQTNAHQKIHDFLLRNNCQKTKPFWFEYSYQIDLAKSEGDLLSAMHPKTRYNINLSLRHKVEVVEDNSDQAFAAYLQLMIETTKRQKFYAHTPEYHQKMWDTLKPAGIAHLMLARYRGKILTAWMLFTFNQVLHYSYGGSSRENKEVMPAYALAWEAIKFGQKKGCHAFDLWGCLGPSPDPHDPWFGFHRFKAGFGSKLVKYLGTYDLVINHQLYPFYNLANEIRWRFLKIKSHLPI